METSGPAPERGLWRPKNSGEEAAAAARARLAETAAPRYVGGRWRLFGIALGRAFITILTLGVGRFWMITRLRRHFWSSIEIAGAPLEYTGRAIELLIGFLIALVVLAVYLMVVNLALTFVGLSFFQGNPLALQLPLVALLPFVPWARYRARRYILARTRWRGIRFGMDPGAWGYAARALGWGLLTWLTLGFLYPLMQMKLARYTADRSWFGDLRFEQRGHWTPLLRNWLMVWLPLPLLMVVGGLWAASEFGGLGFDALDGAGAADDAADETPDASMPLDDPFIGFGAALGAVALYFWMMFAWARYRVFSFRYLNSNKVLGGRTWFEFRLGVWRVIAVYLVGGLAIQFGVVLFAALGGLIAVGLTQAAGVELDRAALDALFSGEAPDIDGLTALGLILAAYLPAIAGAMALGKAFITHPLIAETAATTTIHGLPHVERARQRAHDRQAEAGGFADALGADVGGAF